MDHVSATRHMNPYRDAETARNHREDGQTMNDLIKKVPELIREAAKSPLGLLALSIFLVSIVALAFFTTASELIRVVIFFLIFAGGGLFIMSVLRLAASQDQIEIPENSSSNYMYQRWQPRNNPFIHGEPVRRNSFYGRHKQIAEIRNQMHIASKRCISINGKRRSGKTSLLWYIPEHSLEFCASNQQPLVVFQDLMNARYAAKDSVFDNLRHEIEKSTGVAPWSRDESNLDTTVRNALLQLRDKGYRLIILLDELEILISYRNYFAEFSQYWQDRIAEGVCTLIAASCKPLSEVYEAWGIVSPFLDPFNVTVLGAFEDAEWQSLVRDGFYTAGVEIDETDLELIYDLAGGLPYLTQLAASLLLEHGYHEQTREAFMVEASYYFEYLWNVSEVERNALRYAAGVPRLLPPDDSMRFELQSHGLLHPDGSLFSSAFAEFVQNRR